MILTPQRLEEIASRFGKLRVALVGDICLDRYFEIDPGLQEVSIETKLPVHNVVRVRCQPGGAGTILNNLAALGVGEIWPVAIIGKDGEGFELRRALEIVGEGRSKFNHEGHEDHERGEGDKKNEREEGRSSVSGGMDAGCSARGDARAPETVARRQPRTTRVRLDWVVESEERHTFTYSKPLLMHKARAPEELSRLDMKNWTPTPVALQERMAEAVRALGREVDAMILLDQVDLPETGVVTRRVLEAVREVAEANPKLLVIADSRRSLRGFPKMSFKMNAAELGLFFNSTRLSVEEVKEKARILSKQNGRHVFVTMSERGMVGAKSDEVEWVPALPVRGEIDIVGAGDAVTANLTAALGAGAELREALEMAQLAASVVVHQLGTTGTASVDEMRKFL